MLEQPTHLFNQKAGSRASLMTCLQLSLLASILRSEPTSSSAIRWGRDYRYIEVNRALRDMHPGVAHTVAQSQDLRGEVSRDPLTEALDVNREFAGRSSTCAPFARR
jgi:hypothetical protein